MSVEEANPYLLPLPAQISFSGGRTSGYMLWHILQAFGGKLPDGVRVTFFNTGKEREETLEFVKECGERWGVPIVWLEYDNVRDGGGLKHTYRVVDFASASRKGEPFEKLIDARSFLPNVVARFCTAELKVRIGKKWMMDQGYEHWCCAVGIRADEARRISDLDHRERFDRVHPLVDASVSVEDVFGFWATQPFDLRLHSDEGNCDFCFLKGRKKLVQLIIKRPAMADWWIEQEKKVEAKLGKCSGATFSSRRSFSDLKTWALGGPLFQDQLEVPDDNEVIPCLCTD